MLHESVAVVTQRRGKPSPAAVRVGFYSRIEVVWIRVAISGLLGLLDALRRQDGDNETPSKAPPLRI